MANSARVRMRLCTELLGNVKILQDEVGTKFGAVEEEEEGHKFCVKSRDGIRHGICQKFYTPRFSG